METKQQINEQTLLQEISQKLLTARQEIDEFAVQLALGKAEARDKFEELKDVFIKRLHELNQTFSSVGNKDDVMKKIVSLEAQLNAGRLD